MKEIRLIKSTPEHEHIDELVSETLDKLMGLSSSSSRGLVVTNLLVNISLLTDFPELAMAEIMANAKIGLTKAKRALKGEKVDGVSVRHKGDLKA